MSEFNAALGVLQLKYVAQALDRRRHIDAAYREGLKNVKGIRCVESARDQERNGSYFPILVDRNYPLTRDELHQRLKDSGINPRRYFYPLISDFPMYRALPSARRDNLQHAAVAAEQVLCLPIYPDLESEVVDEICATIRPIEHGTHEFRWRCRRIRMKLAIMQPYFFSIHRVLSANCRS